jgi:uncharacterized protein (TIGR00251 family)
MSELRGKVKRSSSEVATPHAPAWLIPQPPRAVTLLVHVQPGAKKSEVVGVHGERLKIRIAAPPVDGKANAALVAFLATLLDVSKSQIELVAGTSGRQKSFLISGTSAEHVAATISEGKIDS